MINNIKLDKDFYLKKSYELAPLLLGKLICRNIDNKVFKYRISEVEAYYSSLDTACHARFGKTKRTEAMYLDGGILYIYLIYGMYYMMNIVTGDSIPQAVLIRGVDNTFGPGKVTKLLKIDKSFNKMSLINSNLIWLEDDNYHPNYISTKRIGIDYADEYYKNVLWRFIIK